MSAVKENIISHSNAEKNSACERMIKRSDADSALIVKKP